MLSAQTSQKWRGSTGSLPSLLSAKLQNKRLRHSFPVTCRLSRIYLDLAEVPEVLPLAKMAHRKAASKIPLLEGLFI